MHFDPDAIYTVSEVAALAKVSRKTVYRAIQGEYLKAEYPEPAHQYRIWGQAVLDWLGRNKTDDTSEQ